MSLSDANSQNPPLSNPAYHSRLSCYLEFAPEPFRWAGETRHSTLAFFGGRSAEAAPGTQIGTMLHRTDEICFASTRGTVAGAARAHAYTNGLGRVFRDFARSRANAIPFLENSGRSNSMTGKEGTQGSSAARAGRFLIIRVSQQCKRPGGWRWHREPGQAWRHGRALCREQEEKPWCVRPML